MMTTTGATVREHAARDATLAMPNKIKKNLCTLADSPERTDQNPTGSKSLNNRCWVKLRNTESSEVRPCHPHLTRRRTDTGSRSNVTNENVNGACQNLQKMDAGDGIEPSVSSRQWRRDAISLHPQKKMDTRSDKEASQPSANKLGTRIHGLIFPSPLPPASEPDDY